MARKLALNLLVAGTVIMTMAVPAAAQQVQVVPTGPVSWQLTAENLQTVANNRWFGKVSATEVETCAAQSTTVTS